MGYYTTAGMLRAVQQGIDEAIRKAAERAWQYPIVLKVSSRGYDPYNSLDTSIVIDS